MRNVLIVDDEEKIRVMYGRLLTREGFRVFQARNAVQANDILKAHKIDIVLLDINMPDVKGDSLFELIRSFHQKTRVIVSSVYPLEDQERMIRGAHDYFDKSESLKVLIQKIRANLPRPEHLKRILIIDDNPKIRFMYRRLLTKSGYFPIDTGDSYEALSFLKENINTIDLIILDLAMPKISGIEFFETIRRTNPKAKVIIASVFSEDQQKYFIFNANDYFDKSSSHRVLLEKVENLVGV